jgi:hypothetical protein
MRRKFCAITVALSAVWLLAGTTSANAQSTQAIGPVCFSTLPFADVLVWFLNASGTTANAFYFDANGRDLSGDRAQTVSAHVNAAGTTLSFGYTTLPKPGAVPVFAGGTVSLSAGSGPGQCYAPDLASCGAFTMKFIACPATAGEPAATAGRAQGQQP